ncbi:BCCT family transporter [Nocardioides panacisoli]|nr:BCCT family transporter [Nocardioides panacisoli]QYJ05543.1 BCCT family transporter [Nocardioides panacisoli]
MAATALFPEKMGDWIGKANNLVVTDLAWWYVAAVTGFLAFSIWIAVSHMGNVVLGKDGEEPEFSLPSWFAMLFAAGMGIGLVFWGVAEPMSHYAFPPPGLPGANAAEQGETAMNVTFLHWGLHAWAIYVVVGLAVAYSVHRRGNPVSLRWALEPLLGDRIKGFWGDVVDVIAVLGTLFGVATSLGLGVSQVSAGMGYLDWVSDPGTWLKVVLIIVITAIAVTSVVTGVDKGIKFLSNLNMVMAVLLVAFVMIAGPTVFILSDYVTQLGSYFQDFFALSFNVMPFQGEEGETFLSGWTTFYWGWWISWAPFVGVFIARISRGRTVREFIVGVLVVPTLVNFLWFSVMGGTALREEIFGDGNLEALANEDYALFRDTAMYRMLEYLPLAAITAGIAMILVVVFFVTSSDSGSFVVDMLSSGGDPNPPAWSRAFWAVLEGAVAAVLLAAGSAGGDPLGALQTMAILLGAPFSIVMVFMAIATAKVLLAEDRDRKRRERRWLAEDVAREIEASSSS